MNGTLSELVSTLDVTQLKPIALFNYNKERKKVAGGRHLLNARKPFLCVPVSVSATTHYYALPQLLLKCVSMLYIYYTTERMVGPHLDLPF